MPYVLVEELEEGQEEADVRSAEDYSALEAERDAVVSERDAVVSERDELQRNYDSMVAERDNLAAELDNAKTKFADSFLSSTQKMKQNIMTDNANDSKPMTFDQLFKERNVQNAN